MGGVGLDVITAGFGIWMVSDGSEPVRAVPSLPLLAAVLPNSLSLTFCAFDMAGVGGGGERDWSKKLERDARGSWDA